MFIRLVGVLEMRDDDGRVCTPRGAKARAILAMLCQAPDRRRARRWLEARLWSDRGAEQASGSLRQALREIRKALGDTSFRLEGDRVMVRLAGVETDLEQDPAAAAQALASGREFLEAIDIQDPAFEDWLRGERARVAAQPGIRRPDQVAATARLPFVIRLGGLPDGVGSFAGRALGDAVGALLTEFAHVSVYGAAGMPVPADLPPVGMVLHVEGVQIQDQVHVLASLSTIASGRIIWSQRAVLPAAEADFTGLVDLPPLVFQAADAALSHFPQLPECQDGPCRANALIARAVGEMFSYDRARLREADRLLVEAESIAVSARIHAWRVLLRQIMLVERTEPDPARLLAEIDDLARKALQGSKGNPLVLALVGLTRLMIDDKPDAGSILARDALALSPHNAFSHLAQAVALSRQGDDHGALEAARRGAGIAARTAHVHCWEGISGLVALRGRNYQAAIAHYEAAHYRAPGFRAAMRHLVLLYLAAGEREKVARVYRDLLRAEPDFTLDRIQPEPAYLAATLRRSGLLEEFGPDLGEL